MFLDIVVSYSIVKSLLIMCIDCRKTTEILYLESSSTTIQKMEIQYFSQLLVPIGYDTKIMPQNIFAQNTAPFRF